MLVWYTARGADSAALVLLTLATAGGALQSSRRLSPARRVVLQYAHRAGAVAGLVVVLLHVATILADSYAGVGWVGLSYRARRATGRGRSRSARSPSTASSRSRRSGRPVAGWPAARADPAWRGIHLLAYPCWAIAVLHGTTSGTDVGRPWAIALTVACVAAVVGAVAVRVAESRPAHVPVRRRPVEVVR